MPKLMFLAVLFIIANRVRWEFENYWNSPEFQFDLQQLKAQRRARKKNVKHAWKQG